MGVIFFKYAEGVMQNIDQHAKLTDKIEKNGPPHVCFPWTALKSHVYEK